VVTAERTGCRSLECSLASLLDVASHGSCGFLLFSVQFNRAANDLPGFSRPSPSENFELLSVQFVVRGEEESDLRNGPIIQFE